MMKKILTIRNSNHFQYSIEEVLDKKIVECCRDQHISLIQNLKKNVDIKIAEIMQSFNEWICRVKQETYKVLRFEDCYLDINGRAEDILTNHSVSFFFEFWIY